jgi:hypothetical protein
MKWDTDSKAFKDEYITRIASGQTESFILKELSIDWMDFFEALASDPTFRKDIDEARKQRAEIWVDSIVRSLDTDNFAEAKDAPLLKLHFEKLKFLASADNPERYGASKGTKVDVNLDLKQFQLLPPKEALKVLQNDPFNIPVLIGESDGKKEEN